mgnify:CR=1 FL=1
MKFFQKKFLFQYPNSCTNQNGHYECSKCHQPYCSIECFRSPAHHDCSEQFYKRMVMEHLKNVRSDDDNKEFMDILRRNQYSGDYVDILNTSSENDSNETEEIDLDWIDDDRMHQFMERIMSICVDDNVDLDSIWTDRLTESERKEFAEIVQTNPKYFDRIIPEWKPWWCQQEWQAIVEDVDTLNTSKQRPYPSLLNDDHGIEPISKLLSQKSPSPLLIHSIISLCFAYCYLCRLYDGEIENSNVCTANDDDDDHKLWQWSIVEKLFHIVPELQPNVSIRMEKPFDTIELLIERMLTIDHDDDDHDDPLINVNQRKATIIQLFDDLQIIIDWNKPGRRLFIQTTTDKINHKSPKAIVLILSDLYRIIGNIRLQMKKNHHENEEKSIHNNKQQAKLLQQKLRFYLSYTIAMCDEIRQQNWLDVLVFHRERLWQEIQQNDSSSSSSSSS